MLDFIFTNPVFCQYAVRNPLGM